MVNGEFDLLLNEPTCFSLASKMINYLLNLKISTDVELQGFIKKHVCEQATPLF